MDIPKNTDKSDQSLLLKTPGVKHEVQIMTDISQFKITEMLSYLVGFKWL